MNPRQKFLDNLNSIMNDKNEKQYPLRIDPDIYRKAKARAVMENFSMKELFTRLLSLYGSGEINIKGGGSD